MNVLLFVFLFLYCIHSYQCFHQHLLFSKVRRLNNILLRASDKSSSKPGKGFGKKIINNNNNKNENDSDNDNIEIVSNSIQNNKSNLSSIKDIISSEITSTTITTQTDEDIILNSKMFKNRKTIKEDNLKEKMRKLQEEEDLLASDPSVGGELY